MSQKPYAESCEENRQPILDVLKPRLKRAASLLEIGSGTGQHAVYFAPELPHLSWQTSDLAENHPGIKRWLEEAKIPNILPPLQLDTLESKNWPEGPYDAVFSANTTHIMPMEAVEAMFNGVGRLLRAGSPFLLYGPFMYNGRHTSASNQRFDCWLKDRAAHQGVRDLCWLKEVAARAGLELAEDIGMPVNNRILVWTKNP